MGVGRKLLGVALALCAWFSAASVNAAAVTITQHPLPEYRCGARLCKPGIPAAILADGSDRLLAAGVTSGLYGQVTTSPSVTVTPGPSGGEGSVLAMGPDGNPWVLSAGATGKTVQDATPSGVVPRYQFPAASEPTEMAPGADAEWVINGGTIDRVAMNGQLSEFPITESGGVPAAIVGGPEGSSLFTDTSGAIGQVTAAGSVVMRPIADGDEFEGWRFMSPWGIAVAPDGAIAFTESLHERIGEFTSSGELREFAIPNYAPAFGSETPAPRSIIYGPEGDQWFTDPGDGAVGRVTPSGEVTEYRVPASELVEPNEIIVVGDELWFSELNSSTLGSVNPEGSPSEPPLTTPPAVPQVAELVHDEFPAIAGANLRAVRRTHGLTDAFTAPEPGTLTVDWLYQPPNRPGSKKKAPVLVAAGEGGFDFAESKPISVGLTAAGTGLFRHARRLTVSVRATFTGLYCGPIETTGTLRLGT
jgi:virginiamycin B lyase